MWNKLRPMLPHAAIVFANAYVVFFLIDRVNTSMNFIDNNLTKAMLLAMCLITIASWRLSKRRVPSGKAVAKKVPATASAATPRQTAKGAQAAAKAPRAAAGSAGKHVAKGHTAGRSGT